MLQYSLSIDIHSSLTKMKDDYDSLAHKTKRFGVIK